MPQERTERPGAGRGRGEAADAVGAKLGAFLMGTRGGGADAVARRGLPMGARPVPLPGPEEVRRERGVGEAVKKDYPPTLSTYPIPPFGPSTPEILSTVFIHP